MILNAEQLKEFREASEPMLKFLKKMGSPYLSVIFKDNHAELVNGVASNNLTPGRAYAVPQPVTIEIPKLSDNSDDTSAKIREALESIKDNPLPLVPVGCAAVPSGTSKLQQEMDNNYKDIVITWKCQKCGHHVKRLFFWASTEKDITAFEDTLEYPSGCPWCLTIPARFSRIPE